MAGIGRQDFYTHVQPVKMVQKPYCQCDQIWPKFDNTKCLAILGYISYTLKCTCFGKMAIWTVCIAINGHILKNYFDHPITLYFIWRSQQFFLIFYLTLSFFVLFLPLGFFFEQSVTPFSTRKMKKSKKSSRAICYSSLETKNRLCH